MVRYLGYIGLETTSFTLLLPLLVAIAAILLSLRLSCFR